MLKCDTCGVKPVSIPTVFGSPCFHEYENTSAGLKCRKCGYQAFPSPWMITTWTAPSSVGI